jgi:hypothetical protein
VKYLLAIIEIYFGINLFNELLHVKFERISFLSLEGETDNCSFAILNSDVDGSAFAVEEADDGLEDGPLGLVVLEGKRIVLILGDEIFHDEFLSLLE